MRGVQLKRKLKYTGIAGVVATRLLQCNQSLRQYYSECYNRGECPVHNLEITG